ncbi:dihydrodipicolinate synthase family protein [Halalkalicoccus jeotgali]|uniref:Dihydrodipicolinate synthase n=1 Tax=Halalkalicoccus jeotgali (strain DSM 18796 / CECT 7217 / JCM 14584 / KCTC 4019 / B3) TaxID=795797 RepID=D8JA36_HALJB|nr:dihydrodipicolinate synthase family protein [Halalkalicoccus jeotgali]ADJ14558.1 dihydrodipicolinate synthase [Halalkalicoccus jeotgali B3]ELY39930.1 dihydrodipicolinate synthase [Halalkalicoccus jeotgali B3]
MPTLDSSFTGVLCPIVTPLDDGEVDEEALASLTQFILEGGVDGLFPCGTTGEFASLAPEQRSQVIGTVAEVAGDAPVIAGAAATSVPETLERIEEAEAAGADAAAIVGPYFHTANAAGGTQQYFEAVADESALPLYLYNIPMYVGDGIDAETVGALAEHDSIRGMKDTSGDLSYFLSVDRQTPEEFVLFQGFDTLLVPALRMGSNGGVHALGNVIPEVFAELLDSADAERGAELQREAIAPLFELCVEYGFAPATKAALVHRDVIPSDAVKPPLVSLDEEARAEIGEAVDRALDV